MLLLAACGALVAAPAHAADWSPQSEVVPEDAGSPQVAVDDGGNAVMVWDGFDGEDTRVYARSRSAAGALGPVLAISKPGANAGGQRVVMGPGGRALIFWSSGSVGSPRRAQTRWLSASGDLGPIRVLSARGRNAVHTSAGIDRAGSAAFVWQHGRGNNARIQTRRLSARGTLGRVRTLSSRDAPAFDPQLAMAASGRATFVWLRRASGRAPVGQGAYGSFMRVETRASARSGHLSRTAGLSGGERQENADPQVAIDARGNAVYAWASFDGRGERDRGGYYIQVRSRTARGRLSRRASAARAAFDPTLAVAADGRALIGWLRRNPRTRVNNLLARTRSPRGTMGRRFAVSGAAADVVHPRLIMNPAGLGLFAWFDGNSSHQRVQTRFRPPNGALTPIATISTGELADIGFPFHAPALTPAGRALVVWGDVNLLLWAADGSP